MSSSARDDGRRSLRLPSRGELILLAVAAACLLSGLVLAISAHGRAGDWFVTAAVLTMLLVLLARFWAPRSKQ